MENKKTRKSGFWQRWLAKYRFVILNEETFEERFSYKLNRLNVFLTISISIIALIATTFLAISQTSLKEYIPGYDSSELRRQAIRNNYRLDSLQQALMRNQRFLLSVNQVLRGDLDLQELERQVATDSAYVDISNVGFTTSEADSLLRADVAQDEKYNVSETADQTIPFVLFPPAKGTISQLFDPATAHYAVDIVTDRNTPVKAVAEGNVIFAGWTTDTGYVIIINHPYSIISVYKHNASLNVGQGDAIEQGQVIAVTGNSGTMTTGPHLHFELWSNGFALNPTEFIEFEQ
jgi:murein DD-endopeptidase MepM/ murein hydrolase activator NlpD